MACSTPLVLALVVSGAGLSGCTAASYAPSGELRTVSVRSGNAAPTAFHAEVTAGGQAGQGASPLRAKVTLELKGDALEYRMHLQNPNGELVTEAAVVLASDAGAPVIALFSDGRFRNEILELRGTATVRASERAAVIAEELSATPARFAVVLRGGGQAWTGAVKLGR